MKPSSGTSEEALVFSRYTMSAMFKKDADRRRYLNKEFTNNLKRNLAYRNLLYFVNKGCPLGRYNRVVVPRCAVVKIRETFPSEEYTRVLRMFNLRLENWAERVDFDTLNTFETCFIPLEYDLCLSNCQKYVHVMFI